MKSNHSSPCPIDRRSAGKWDADNLYYNKCTGNASLDYTEAVGPGVTIQDAR